MAPVAQSAVFNLAPAPVDVPAPARRAQVSLPKAHRGVGALLAVAGVSGFVLALYRNDALLGLAHSAGLDAQYLRVEHALGSPGFGTPRSLDASRYVPPAVAATPEVPSADSKVGLPPSERKEEAEAKPSTGAEPTESGAAASEPLRAEAKAGNPVATPAAKVRAVASPKPVAVAPKRAHAAAKQDAAEPPVISLADESANESPPPKKDSASKKKEKDAEAKQDTPPALSLDDAIKASMKKH